MSNLHHITEFIKDQIKFHKDRSIAYEDNNWRKNKHLETLSKFEKMLDFVQEQEQKILDLQAEKEQKIPDQLRLSLTPDDIEGLPPAQLDELTYSGADKAEFSIISMMEKNGGLISLDQIIVGLYRETREVQKRSTVTSKIYRMVKKGLIHNVPSKKGIYSLDEITEEQAKEMFKA